MPIGLLHIRHASLPGPPVHGTDLAANDRDATLERGVIRPQPVLAGPQVRIHASKHDLTRDPALVDRGVGSVRVIANWADLDLPLAVRPGAVEDQSTNIATDIEHHVLDVDASGAMFVCHGYQPTAPADIEGRIRGPRARAAGMSPASRRHCRR